MTQRERDVAGIGVFGIILLIIGIGLQFGPAALCIAVGVTAILIGVAGS